MSIYDKKAFGYDFSYKSLKGPLTILAAIIAVAVIVMLLFTAASIFQPKALEISFEKNPLKLGEQSLLYAKVFNSTGKSASGVLVEVNATDEKALLISAVEPNDGKISVIGENESRQLVFLVNPTGSALEGKYTVTAKATINGQEATAQAVLELEK
ncbi:MAG: hypothetical protein V1494_01365 [Candidatus Diapherotrites archaeon]